MIAEHDLVEEFGEVERLEDVFVFQDKMRSYTYHYWLKSNGECDALVVSQDDKDDSVALNVLSALPECLALAKPTIYKLVEKAKSFTHVIAVPPNYHGYLKGADDIKRDNLFLCVPIYRCEFSGDETPEEFKEIRLNFVPSLDWSRVAHPKLRVYFDNPKTGGGSSDAGVLFKMEVLINEVDNLNGVSDGFIEVTNYVGSVVEVLSPAQNQYILIRNREDEEPLSRDEIVSRLADFSTFSVG